MDRIEQLLVDAFGHDRVSRQYTYPTGRRVDLLVDTGLFTVAIECESSAENLIEGSGQVEHYARHDSRGRTVPMLVVADGHTLDSPEQQYVEQRVTVYTERELAERLTGAGLLG
ncbi:hypothetical protein [Halomarina oriensis]|uniref:Restriction endonuclease type IV Mrr domain-containing protein n=1 Tax=Halomarina oriensis TaxID=671145 RepID=A0A6B0GNW6_9EURY|nr:hypothetical protein [Halomarina oriensis]MWG36484.1 hypothetical protein [Halomarina oriensis]